jgi:hypothetical protein
MTTLLGMVAVVLGAAVVATPAAQAEPNTAELYSMIGDVHTANFSVAPVGPGRDACPTFYLCMWTGTDFLGSGLGLSGNLVHGDFYELFGGGFQDHVYSAVNKTTVRLTFYNVKNEERTYLGYLDPGFDFASGWAGSNRVDAVYYD